MYSYVGPSLCVCAHVCACTLVRSRGHPRCYSLVPFTCLLRQGLSLAWNSLIRLGWLTREHQLQHLSNSPALRLQAFTSMLGFLLWWWLVDWLVRFFMWALGTKLRFLYLQGKKPFTHWASPQAWTCLLNTFPPTGLCTMDHVQMVSMVTYKESHCIIICCSTRQEITQCLSTGHPHEGAWGYR